MSFSRSNLDSPLNLLLPPGTLLIGKSNLREYLLAEVPLVTVHGSREVVPVTPHLEADRPGEIDRGF